MSGELRDELLETVRDLEPVIRKNSDESERQRHLADPIVEGLRAAGLFRMVTPKALGGLGVDLITHYRVIEAIAAIDGSTGWCMFINGGCPVTGAFLPDHVAERIYGEPNAIGSGTVFPFGRAERTDGGFRVRGRWPYASGCWHSTWHFAFCYAYAPGAEDPLIGENGEPLVVAPHLPRDQVNVIDTWDVSGLAGTGSHDVEIDAFVSAEQTWTVGTAAGGAYTGPMYRVPLLATFGWPMAAVALGIARGAIDEVMRAALTKRHVVTGQTLVEQPTFQTQIAHATAKLESARAWLHERLDEMWDQAIQDEPVSPHDRALSHLATTHAVQESANAVELAYRAGGASANYLRSPLQRKLRDANAVTQHFATAPAQFPAAGAMLLGLPAQWPLLLL